MEINICRKNKFGYRKYENNCHFRHVKLICIDNSCNIFNCEKRHPKICDWYRQYGRCKFTTFCKYKHVNTDSIDELSKSIQENTTKLIEIEKALEAIKNEEETVQNKIEVFKEQLERKCEEFENKFSVVF